MDNRFEISIGGEDREIFMSFGLLNELSKLVGDPVRVASIVGDPDLREEVLKALLMHRKRSGKILDPKQVVDVDDIDADYEQIERLLHWAMEHVLGFFVRLLRSARDVASSQKNEMEGLVSSLIGSDVSPSKMELSGLSE